MAASFDQNAPVESSQTVTDAQLKSTINTRVEYLEKRVAALDSWIPILLALGVVGFLTAVVGLLFSLAGAS